MRYGSAILTWAGPAVLVLTIVRYLCARIIHVWTVHRRGCRAPPSYPERYPVLGLDWARNAAQGIKDGRLYAALKDDFQRLGRTFRASSMGNNVIHTMDMQNIQTVLTLDFASYGVEPTRKISAEPLLGKGVFTSDGDFWAMSRRIGKPLFTRAQIADFTQFGKHVDRLLALIPRDGSTVDLLPLCKRLFLDRATELFFGESIDALADHKSADSKSTRFLAAFDTAMAGMRARKELGPLYFLRGRDRKWKAACAQVHTFVDAHVQRAMQRRSEKQLSDANAEPLVFVDLLVRELDDPLAIRSQLLNIFQAARDSTAISLSNMFFHLARHPEIWSQLREEAMAVSGPLTYEMLKSMTHLQCFIKESMRLSGPTGLCQRICIAQTVLPRGGGAEGIEPILVEKGDMIMINFRAMHCDEQLWGDDAEEFRPERWQTARPLWQYLPFLGGPRICPASQLALGQCAYVLVRFLREFPCLEKRDDEAQFIEETRMLCESRNGVKVAFQSANMGNLRHREKEEQRTR